MTTQTATLADFLLARIAEDEERANYALSRGGTGALDYGGQWYGAVVHAQRWEPARVSVECFAKRRIVAQSERVLGLPDEDEANWLATLALRALAIPYADHPDFREDW